jgi:hypothetical protein
MKGFLTHERIIELLRTREEFILPKDALQNNQHTHIYEVQTHYGHPLMQVAFFHFDYTPMTGCVTLEPNGDTWVGVASNAFLLLDQLKKERRLRAPAQWTAYLLALAATDSLSRAWRVDVKSQGLQHPHVWDAQRHLFDFGQLEMLLYKAIVAYHIPHDERTNQDKTLIQQALQWYAENRGHVPLRSSLLNKGMLYRVPLYFPSLTLPNPHNEDDLLC